MKEKIRRDRKLLLMFFLLWIALSGWSLQYKKADLSNLPQGKLIIVWGIGIMALVSLIMSCIYVFKMYKWYNSPKAPALVMAILYFIFAFILPLIPLLIGAGILWKSRELLVDKS